VTISLGARGVRAVVLDIEGTTTPITFVYDVLFPYARAHMREYVRTHADRPEMREPERLLRTEWVADVARGEALPVWEEGNASARIESVAAYSVWLMDRDRKSSGLKLLQGQIWEGGYGSGELQGDVFPDVPRALERWRAASIDVAIYSSGSVLAQRLLFGSTAYGDLTKLMVGFFDTGVGAKVSSDSYVRIASEMKRAATELLFISDVAIELTAARDAGWQALLCVRPGNAPQAGAEWASPIGTFDEVAA
jgi:enolase-phosphatase E1